MNRVGGIPISDVVQVEHEWKVSRQLMQRERATCYEQLTFFRAGEDEPPEIEVPCVAPVLAAGQDFGTRRICCTGRDPRPGGYFWIKWEA